MGVAQLVQRATPGEEIIGSFPDVATRSLPAEIVPALSRVWQQVKLSVVSLGTRRRYKPTRQTMRQNRSDLTIYFDWRMIYQNMPGKQEFKLVAPI